MWLLKKFAAVIITFFFVTIALFFFFYYLHSLSVETGKTELDTGEITATVNVYEHTAGIKHIVAKNESDAYFGIGYIQAMDRMFQMDILRRTAKGELSEIFGKDYLSFDKYMRTLNVKDIAVANRMKLHLHVLNLLEQYSNGVNFYIKRNKKKLHFAFSTFNYLPKPWTVEDCLAIQRLFAYQMSTGFKADLNFGSIAEITGVDNTLRLLPDFEKNSLFVYDELPKDSNWLSSENLLEKAKYLVEYTGVVKTFREKVYLIQAKDFYIGNIMNNNSGFGCNVWAMKKIQMENAEAILANDFHSELTIPSMWQQLHISYPGTNCAGYALAGIPFILSGRNDNVAWGIANAMIDDCDYFIEKADEKSDTYKTTMTESDKFSYKKDTIKIAKSEDYIYYLKSTRRSSVISDFYSSKAVDKMELVEKIRKPKILDKYVLSYKWTGSFISDEMTPLYLLTKVKNWDEFKYSFKTWKSPSMNFVYADNKGNIGLLTAGSLPKRGASNNMIIPNPGWLPEYDWDGLDTSGVIAEMYNPPKNYVSAANNPLKSKTNYSKYFDMSSRADRIEELIGQYQRTDNYTIGTIDVQRMQTDILSDFSRKLFALTKPVMESHLNTLKEQELQAYRIIKNWDFLQTAGSPAPAIFNMFTIKLIENIFLSQLGKEAFNYYLDMPHFAMNKTLEILSAFYSSEEDNMPSVEEQTRIYTIMISFKQAVDTLTGIFVTTDISKWNYGYLHNLKLRIPINVDKFLEPVFKINDVQRNGGITTINYSAWSYFEPFKIVSSSSFRLIADLSETNVAYSFPGGVSEDPINPNYSSQLHLWENGAYLKIPFLPDKLKEVKLILTLY